MSTKKTLLSTIIMRVKGFDIIPLPDEQSEYNLTLKIKSNKPKDTLLEQLFSETLNKRVCLIEMDADKQIESITSIQSQMQGWHIRDRNDGRDVYHYYIIKAGETSGKSLCGKREITNVYEDIFQIRPQKASKQCHTCENKLWMFLKEAQVKQSQIEDMKILRRSLGLKENTA